MHKMDDCLEICTNQQDVFSYEHKFSPENSQKPSLAFRFISVKIILIVIINLIKLK